MKNFREFELKYRRFAIPNLMMYLTALYAAGFVVNLMLPQVYASYLSLDFYKIMHGQVWRLITWLMYPPASNWLVGAIMIYVYYMIGQTLERMWGSFKFNIFIFSGIIFHWIAAFIIYELYKGADYVYILTPNNLNLSILLAMILTFPDAGFLLFFFIPVKAKWLGIFYAVMTVISFIQGNTAGRIEIVMSLLNIVVFLIITGKMKEWLNTLKQKRKN